MEIKWDYLNQKKNIINETIHDVINRNASLGGSLSVPKEEKPFRGDVLRRSGAYSSALAKPVGNKNLKELVRSDMARPKNSDRSDLYNRSLKNYKDNVADGRTIYRYK